MCVAIELHNYVDFHQTILVTTSCCMVAAVIFVLQTAVTPTLTLVNATVDTHCREMVTSAVQMVCT